jgi:hypothetical protein
MQAPDVWRLTLMLKHDAHNRSQLRTCLLPMGAKVPRICGVSGDRE